MNKEVFEIHITGDESILQAAPQLGLKTISIDLLKPDFSVLRAEHMTSCIQHHFDYDSCLKSVLNSVELLKSQGVKVQRVKIECPFYEHYKDQACYIESHFNTEQNYYPISRNRKKSTLLGTVRTYDKDEFDPFFSEWKHVTVELCLYDDFVEEDSDWLGLWSHKNVE